jgi:alpha-D-xyloside xylohydrolase
MLIATAVRLSAAALLLGASTAATAAGSYRKIDNGVIVMPAIGPEKAVRLMVYGDRIVRVTSTPDGEFNLPPSLTVVAQPLSSGFTVTEQAGEVMVRTPIVTAAVRLDDGNVRFLDATGELDLQEAASGSFTPVQLDGKPYLATRQQFNRGTDEGLFGLGQHQNGQMNYNGEDVELAQHNMDIAVPFLVSTRNYGILWDNYSITRFGNPKAYSLAGEGKTSLRVTDEAGRPGWTARYYLGDRLATTRTEATLDYQYIDDQAKWPAEAKVQTVAATTGQNTAGNAVQTQRVVWTGKITPGVSGLNRFRLYSSSYVKVFADGKEVINRWRQNWNPWYHNFDLEMTAGKPVDLRIEWEPNAGYIALLHNDPQPEPDRRSISFASEAGKAIDYYYVGAGNLDGVISGYRQLTGKSAMMPKWAYGFWQSRQRYNTQAEVAGVVAEYRKRKLPLDNIVQDWFYWPEDQWGCQCFDAKRFPDPDKMVRDVHAAGARIMISVWAKLYTDTQNFKELDAVGGMLRGMDTPARGEPADQAYIKANYRDWVGPGYRSGFYDPYNPRAAEIFWRQVRDGIASKGFDAWWLDSNEPDFHSNLSIDERIRRMGPFAAGPAAALFNTYPLVHVDNFAKNLVEYKPDVRPFILSRSGFAGIQRSSTALWSGDVVSRWDDLYDQISAGVNLSMSGIPNWTTDIGGFANEDRYTKGDPKHLAEWRELNMRWFQFGAFSPLFRSHGEAPKREIYELAPTGSRMYRAMEWYDKLRYRLMPYIYTLGADTFHKDATIMRGLAMDFPEDRKGWDIKDQYLFGPAFLVAPVTRFKARSRSVYLPAGANWYDFHTGRLQTGGATVTAAAPLERMPLFVRAGSIVPTGPAVQSTAERGDSSLTLNVYTGADGSFSLYEDDGTSRQYLNGAFSRIPMAYDEQTKTLVIGKREGRYIGMPGRRTISVRWMSSSRPQPFALDAQADANIVYTGESVSLKFR